jgi:hypothetical protein
MRIQAIAAALLAIGAGNALPARAAEDMTPGARVRVKAAGLQVVGTVISVDERRLTVALEKYHGLIRFTAAQKAGMLAILGAPVGAAVGAAARPPDRWRRLIPDPSLR